ncbi:MAG: bifunctional diaminohydroxyphosphoribosylaminopyrimidine deaminase/5-amino-6-(5-phosphoribosylamino)uracil reductase RibD [Alphaproteobacteria bacterium]|nr:bifunctional diaminohydroxyphosphoribosylaminopyrimidine deaminase/5-amino-6-(5-phosphoribosylamino)uracil reductase RibD [Alphaproteobacteria bacterium]
MDVFSPHDKRYMRYALALARRGLGYVAPNPSVGCVLVKDGHIVGSGRTSSGGRPHAEIVALKEAGFEARGSTAYVSLEPCAHHGETPPCTGALIEAGVRRVIAACEDPDPRVSGQGLRQLHCAGIEVASGLLEEEARALNQGFFLKVLEARPLVTLKIATGSDSRILPGKGGVSQWVTGPLSRRRAHLERSLHDAILIGAGTLRADNPSLTTRLPGLGHTSLRIVLSTNLDMPEDAALFSKNIKGGQAAPVLVIHGAEKAKGDAFLLGCGAHVRTKYLEDTRDIGAVLRILAQEEGITRLLVEGGPRVHASFIHAGVCDRFLWFKGAEPAGKESLPALDGLEVGSLPDDLGLVRRNVLSLEPDRLEIYEKGA